MPRPCCAITIVQIQQHVVESNEAMIGKPRKQIRAFVIHSEHGADRELAIDWESRFCGQKSTKSRNGTNDGDGETKSDGA